MQQNNLTKQQCTEEFKIEAIRLAESIGDHEAAPAGRADGHGGHLEEKTSSMIEGNRSARSLAQRCGMSESIDAELVCMAPRSAR
jgi:hypothetical protein